MPDIIKNKVKRLDIDSESKKKLRNCIVQLRKDGKLKSRQLWQQSGFDIALKHCLGTKEANKIIRESNKFQLPKGLAKRLEKYTKTQQKKILKAIELKVQSKEIKKSDLWKNGLLSEIIDQVVEK